MFKSVKSVGQVELLGFALGLVASCSPSRATKGHCANQDGDAFCAEKYGDGSRDFCARGIPGCEEEQPDGCVAARPVEDACYSPCGGGRSLDEDPECEGAADGSSSSLSGAQTDATTEPTGGPTTAGSMSASGTEGSSSTTSSGCTESSECGDPASPICVDTACVPCTSDEECLAKSPGAPACNEDGQCVTCTPTNASACTDTTPICNAVNECEGCEFHEQCAGTACDIATGACFAEDCVVEVDGDGGADYENIQAALVDGCVVMVHELNGGDSYSQFSVDGITVAVLAADGEEPIVVGLAGSPSLNVSTDAVAYVQGLTFTDSDVEGITADGGTLYLERTLVVGNTGGGIMLTNDAHGYVRTCIIGGNGTGAGPSSGLTVNGSTLDVLYSTIARNDADTADDSLSCAGGSTVTVRNSILVGRDDPSVMCAGATIEDSALDQAFGTNTDVGAIQNTWFDNVAGNVFTLSAAGGAAFGDVAEWAEGDPATDINGELRPTQPGPDVAGADIP